ncbi:MAG: alpha/beta hydrolase [Nostocaceae cyanobacterium]|nr:alpha/beta hydrolase [Nostocaceae cyanobacterium]
MGSQIKEFQLPAIVKQLTESTSTALAASIKQIEIATPVSKQPIATTFVNQGSSDIPLLLLHGFDSSVLEFRRLLPALAANHQTWAVDLLGFGFTDRQPGISYSTADIKTHLYHFWKTLINQPVILLGASMGGAAAIDFSLTYPEIVHKLVLIDSAGLTGGSPLTKLMFPPLDKWATEFLRNPKIRQSISRAAYKDKSFASVDAQICAASHLEMSNWNQALISFTKSGGYQPFRFTKLSQIQQQTLILWGDNDKILGTKDANRFKRAIPNSKVVWIKDCGHVPHLEKSQTTADKISEFVQ